MLQRMSYGAAAKFCQRLGAGTRAGVDILRLLQQETKHGRPVQRTVMAEVLSAVRAGYPLPEALSQQGGFFPPLLVAMVSAGEATGKLEQTMLVLGEYFDQRVRIRREFLQQIAWPVFQLFVAINVIGLLIYILGVLRPATGGEMMDVLGFGLRGGTGVAVYYGYVFGFLLFVALALLAFQKNFMGVHNLLPLLYRIPLFGTALQTITLARFTWTFALSLEAGLDPIRSIHLGLDATASDFYRSGKHTVETAIRTGGTMTEALAASEVFPEEFLATIEAAELSGTDAEAMQHLAADYDERARLAMRTLGTLASRGVWLFVTVLLVYLILKIAMTIGGAYRDAMQPI